MACPCTTNSCNNCSCTYPSTTACVTWKGASISCGDTVIATQGDVLTDILTNITDLACGNITPSGQVYIVEGVTNQTTVTENTVGNETTYTVGLASAITTTISNHTSSIASINACLTNTVEDLISDTITITEESSDSCGRTLRLEFTPSGSVSYDGIVYNDTTKVGTTGGVGNKTLKSFDYDYLFNNNITENDEIRFKATGQIFGDTDDVDTVKLEIYDSNSSTLLYGESFGGFDKVNKQSWVLNGELTVGTGDEALLSLNFLANSKQNGTKATPNSASQVVVNYDVTGIDWTGLEIRIVYVHDSTSGATFNFARQLLVEVRKYIG